MGLGWGWAALGGIAPLIVATVVGNVLVVLSIVVYRRMRTFSNVLLVSLAASDVLVGLGIAPLALADLAAGHAWPLGETACALWSTFDVLLCTASILNLAAINLDRYLAITRPLSYPRSRSPATAAAYIAAVWLSSALICSPPWIVPQWKGLQAAATPNSSAILCGYTRSVSYRLYSAAGSFFIPLALIVFVYARIYHIATSREKLLHQDCHARRSSGDKLRICYSQSQAGLGPGLTSKGVQPAGVARVRASLLRRQQSEGALVGSNVASLQVTRIASAQPPSSNVTPRSSFALNSTPAPSPTPYSGTGVAPSSSRDLSVMSDDEVSATLLPQPKVSAVSAASSSRSGKTKARHRATTQIRRERKAIMTIGVVVSGFILCWLPFFLLYVTQSFVELSGAWSNVLGDVFLWLGYSNSAVNPLVYAAANRDFRRCFRDLLQCGCLRLKRNSRRLSVYRLHQNPTNLL